MSNKEVIYDYDCERDISSWWTQPIDLNVSKQRYHNCIYAILKELMQPTIWEKYVETHLRYCDKRDIAYYEQAADFYLTQYHPSFRVDQTCYFLGWESGLALLQSVTEQEDDCEYDSTLDTDHDGIKDLGFSFAPFTISEFLSLPLYDFYFGQHSQHNLVLETFTYLDWKLRDTQTLLVNIQRHLPKLHAIPGMPRESERVLCSSIQVTVHHFCNHIYKVELSSTDGHEVPQPHTLRMDQVCGLTIKEIKYNPYKSNMTTKQLFQELCDIFVRPILAAEYINQLGIVCADVIRQFLH
jgi:hypothetical protein